MNTTNMPSKSASAGLFAAFIASLCCITPVFSLLAGIGGIAATFSWVEPFRPYLIVLTIGILGFAWYQKLKPRTAEELKCACEEDERPPFVQSKKFLGIVTAFAAMMLAFPAYSNIFYQGGNYQNASLAFMQDTTKTNVIVLDVKGMTCSSCENHIEHEVKQLQGVKKVEASYPAGTTSVEYFPSQLDRKSIVDAINNTGYQVVEHNENTMKQIDVSDHISFYKVPLVCNAAPTIGCGSRAKPVLTDFEKAKMVDEAWLNRQGTVIAVVWEKESDFKARRNLATEVFTSHKVNASKLLMNDYVENQDSFNEKSGWLRSSDVDKLSKEEAAIIADQLLAPIKNKSSISKSDEQKLRDKISDTFYNFFLDFESVDQLNDPKVYREKLGAIINFGEKLLGKGKMPSVDELWKVCSTGTKNCSHDGCTDSSCKVNN